MIYTARAAAQVEALRLHYRSLDRVEAIRNLDDALAEAERRIERDPKGGLPAPRPYPGLVRAGRAWIKVGRYWIAFSNIEQPVIVAVAYDTANIPDRT